MRLGQTSIVLSASKFIGSGLGFLATVYFARELGQSVLGQYALVLALVTWLGIVGEVGLSKAISKRISEGEDQSAFVGAAIITLGGLFALAAVGVLVAGPLIDQYVGADVAAFVVILLGLNLVNTLTNAALQGRNLVHVYGALSAVERTVRTVAQVLLVVVGLGLTGMLLGYVVSGLLAGVVGLYYLGIRPSIPDREHVASLFEFAKYAWLGNVSNRAYSSLDMAVLGLFVSSGLIGIYSVAWSIAMFLNIFGSSLEGTLFPEMSKTAAGHGSEAVRDLTEEALRYSGLITIPGLVGGLVVGDRLLRIYGASFEKGAPILAILVGAALVYAYVRQLRNTLNAIDRPELAFRVNAVFIGANVVLNVVLIWRFGWLGAAVATLVSAGIGSALAYWYVQSEVGISFPLRSIGRQWIAALAMGSLVFALRRLLESNWGLQSNVVFVGLLVSVGAAVYFGVLAAIWPAFRLTIVNNLPTRRLPG
jgi:O-antigen/teichoic acid export membrane protein